MVLINKAINEVTVKLVYYGPGLCGKTTNLEKIYANPKLDHKGKMISMSTETDRTLFFDFMPMELGTIAGQKVRVQLYTVPGQVFYDATRKLVLRGADGVVFVADSQASMKESNLDSLRNLRTNLRVNRIDPNKVAMVFQYNKRDLPNVSSVEEMNAYMNPGDAPVIEASALTGTGVTATLRAAVARILDNIKSNVDTVLHDEPALTAPDMSQRSGVATHSAGTPKLSMRTDAGSTPRPSPPAAAVVPQRPPAAEMHPMQTDPFAAEPIPASAPFDSPFHTPSPIADEEAQIEAAVEAVSFDDEDPFADMAVVAEPEFAEVETEDPFSLPAAGGHDASNDRAELEELLANARGLVASLETALERARESERKLAAKLAR
jgi:signal recognition particle receptor subunit beta